MIDLEKVVPLGKQLLTLKENWDKDQLLHQAVEIISQTLKFYFVGIYLVDDNRKRVVLKAGSGEGGKRMVARNHNVQIYDGYPQKGTEKKI